MVKHNNVIPNGHFHKDWQNRVKTWFDQPTKKKARRLARKEKAAACAPRPLEKLRPAVHGQTIKYNNKVKLGRGFSLEELKEAGISAKFATTVGIAVDKRRHNKSVESLQLNVARLQEYKSKLVVFPRKNNQKPRGGDSKPEETAAAVQVLGTIMPLKKAADVTEFAAITPEMKAFMAYSTLRVARNEAALWGLREKKKNAPVKE
jgi:large subunit ribosomal protein L13e